MIKFFIAGVAATVLFDTLIINNIDFHSNMRLGLGIGMGPFFCWCLIISLSMWAGYQRFMMIMIFNPDSAECEIAQDWPRRKQMKFQERFNYELAIWAYIIFWPLIELAGLAMSTLERCKS